MPKSGHMANQHGKTCAAAVVALLTGKQPNTLPIYTNTCYSFVSAEDAVHVASVHRYDAGKEDDADGAGLGWRLQRGERTRRRICHGLGTQYLGGHTGLMSEVSVAGCKSGGAFFDAVNG